MGVVRADEAGALLDSAGALLERCVGVFCAGLEGLGVEAAGGSDVGAADVGSLVGVDCCRGVDTGGGAGVDADVGVLAPPVPLAACRFPWWM
jgi:hypothetical protein